MRRVGRTLQKTLPAGQDDRGKRSFKLIVYLSIGIILVMVIASVITFFMTLQGAEQTLVPNVQGMDLANGIIQLQQKGLIPDVTLRVSANPADKGTILSQDPSAGTLVKAGRSVTLRVSKGPVIDEVANYVGQKLTDVELTIQSMSTIYGPILKVKQPVMEVFNDSPAGTILQQKPLPGTKITGVTELDLVVSRGPQGSQVVVGNYVGLSFKDALAQYSQTNAPFLFMSRAAGADEKPGTVVSQSPAAGVPVPAGTQMQFTITDPNDVPQNEVFGILNRTLPDYSVPIDLTIEAVSPDGQHTVLLHMKYPGGAIGIPYELVENSQIVATSAGRELFRYTVTKPTS